MFLNYVLKWSALELIKSVFRIEFIYLFILMHIRFYFQLKQHGSFLPAREERETSSFKLYYLNSSVYCLKPVRPDLVHYWRPCTLLYKQRKEKVFLDKQSCVITYLLQHVISTKHVYNDEFCIISIAAMLLPCSFTSRKSACVQCPAVFDTCCYFWL